MLIYQVLLPLRHDGKDYAVGASLALEESQALPLLLAGVLQAAPTADKTSADTVPPAEADEAPPAEADETPPAEEKAKPKSKAKAQDKEG